MPLPLLPILAGLAGIGGGHMFQRALNKADEREKQSAYGQAIDGILGAGMGQAQPQNMPGMAINQQGPMSFGSGSGGLSSYVDFGKQLGQEAVANSPPTFGGDPAGGNFGQLQQIGMSLMKAGPDTAGIGAQLLNSAATGMQGQYEFNQEAAAKAIQARAAQAAQYQDEITSNWNAMSDDLRADPFLNDYAASFFASCSW